MKKIFGTLILICAMTANTFAFDFGAVIASFFGINKNTAEVKSDLKIETKSENTIPNSKTRTVSGAEVKIISATTTTESKKVTAPCAEGEELDKKSEKINVNIKNQIIDRDKVIASLKKVASSTEVANVKAVQAKMVEVRLKIDATIELEKQLLNQIEEAKAKACIKTIKKEAEAVALPRMMLMSVPAEGDSININADISVDANVEIKKTEDQVSKELKDVKTFLKVDLKAFLESLYGKEKLT